MARFEIVDEDTVLDADGRRHDVREAIATLPWVDQLCPLMPYQYAHQQRHERDLPAGSAILGGPALLLRL